MFYLAAVRFFVVGSCTSVRRIIFPPDVHLCTNIEAWVDKLLTSCTTFSKCGFRPRNRVAFRAKSCDKFYENLASRDKNLGHF